MPIELIGIEEVVGRIRTKKEKYGKYVDHLKKHIEWIKENVRESKDGHIRMKVKDLAKEMGPEFVERDERSIYNGVRYVLFNEGIVVDFGAHKDGNKLLIMRLATDADQLPPSLAKYLESEEE